MPTITKAAATCRPVRRPRIALASATTGLTLSAVMSLSGGALAVEADVNRPYLGLTPISAVELAELRGGFRWNNSIIDFSTRILGRGPGNTLVFDTVLKFPTNDLGNFNGIGVTNTGPSSLTPHSLAGGGVELKHGDANSPQVTVQVPRFNTTIHNNRNDQTLKVETVTSVNISNSGWLTSGSRRLSGNVMGSFRRSRW